MTPADLAQVMEATWPPAQFQRLGPWTIRSGRGGGKRVSAATAEDAITAADLPLAEAAMHAMDQPPLFLIREGDAVLDALLQAAGYRIVDPVTAYSAPLSALPPPPDAMTVFAHWPPLAVARDLWADAGIGPARLEVMNRVAAPKTALLARANDRAVGVAFVAVALDTAMLHALEVSLNHRRQGSAHNMLRAAAGWAQSQGAATLSLVVTTANVPARTLYASMGMQVVGQYHYRQK